MRGRKSARMCVHARVCCVLVGATRARDEKFKYEYPRNSNLTNPIRTLQTSRRPNDICFFISSLPSCVPLLLLILSITGYLDHSVAIAKNTSPFTYTRVRHSSDEIFKTIPRIYPLRLACTFARARARAENPERSLMIPVSLCFR